MTQPYLTTKQAAARLGVSIQRIKQFVEMGRLTRIMINPRCQVFAIEEVDRFAAIARKVGRPKSSTS